MRKYLYIAMLIVCLSTIASSQAVASTVEGEIEIGHIVPYTAPNQADSIYMNPEFFNFQQQQNFEMVDSLAGLSVAVMFCFAVFSAMFN